jgi:hypothetical protein
VGANTKDGSQLTGLILARRRRRSTADLLVKNSPNAAAQLVFGDWLFDAASSSTNYADNLSAGSYTYTGQSVTDVKASSSTAYADTLTKGAYTYSGIAISDSKARADNLSAGAYTVTGKTLTDTKAIADSLSKGTYTYAGQQVTDVKVGAPINYADTLTKGSYTYTGLSITDSKVVVDTLSPGTYALSGKDIADRLGSNIADALQVGSYVITGQSVTDIKTGAIAYLDNLEVGSYVVTGSLLVDDYVSANIQSSGGGYFHHLDRIKRLKAKKKKEELDALEAYQELIDIAPESIKQEAVRLIKPFTDSKAKTPQVKSIDWVAIEYDRYRVQALIKLWEEQKLIDEEDEEILMLL